MRVMGGLGRHKFLLGWMGAWGPVDTLNRQLVVQYAYITGAKVDERIIGADKCRLLASDLRDLWKLGRCTRYTSGIEGLSGQGFPKWVWSYRLKEGQ